MTKSDQGGARVYLPIKVNRDDISGQSFGLLTVKSLLGSYKNKHFWRCVCACGGVVDVATTPLRNGNTKSCGCIARAKTVLRNTTHGMGKHPLYGMWRRMLQRCEDTKCGDYKYYGLRGITVCARWHDFPSFVSDVGDRPDGHTLERVRNDEGYGPGNFKWATRQEQMQNTRQTRLIEHEGRVKSVSAWAREFGIKPRTLSARLNALGYSFEDAIAKSAKCGVMLNGKTWAQNKEGANDDKRNITA